MGAGARLDPAGPTENVLIDPSVTSPNSPRKGPELPMSGALVAHLAGGLALRTVVRGEDEQRVVVDLEFLQRVEDLADVVVAFHDLVAVLTNLGLSGELL